MSQLHTIKMLVIVIAIFLGIVSCQEENTSSFTADFDYEFVDDNHVNFINRSEGEYYSLDWDFGNGVTETSTNKSKTHTIYYSDAGSYNVILTLLDYSGNTKQVVKTIQISRTDLIVSFNATIDPANPNNVILENNTEGNYESLTWIYRNIEIVNEESTVAYFPYAGTYSIELQIKKASQLFSSSQTVSILKDDPDYVSTFELVWADEFNGTEVNSNNWTFETGATGWGNYELQNYTNGNNAKVENGVLIITARKLNNNTEVGSYTSTRIKSEGKQEFTYGKIEIRAKLPSGTGIWPAIWMLGANFGTVGWPACGEIDIMEYVGYEPNTVHATVHNPAGYGGNANGSSITIPTAEEEFHVYGLLWTEKELVFYVDEMENVVHTYAPAVKTNDNWPYDKPHFFILNIAVGGNWGGVQGVDNSIFPQSMEVDYVRVYQSGNKSENKF